jgi:uncharacterized iron-regulated membrane protein
MTQFLLLAVLWLFAAIRLVLSIWRAWPRRVPEVVFRGTREQAEREAAWRAMQASRPVVAVHAGGDVWEFEHFVARSDATG